MEISVGVDGTQLMAGEELTWDLSILGVRTPRSFSETENEGTKRASEESYQVHGKSLEELESAITEIKALTGTLKTQLRLEASCCQCP